MTVLYNELNFYDILDEYDLDDLHPEDKEYLETMRGYQ